MVGLQPRLGCAQLATPNGLQQATPEAPRAEILIAVTEMELAKKRTSGDPPLQ